MPILDMVRLAAYQCCMEENQTNKSNTVFQRLNPYLAKAGHKSISLLTAVRVFAPKAISSPLLKTQQLLEKLFPKEPQP
jgi:hypothetical protein